MEAFETDGVGLDGADAKQRAPRGPIDRIVGRTKALVVVPVRPVDLREERRNEALDEPRTRRSTEARREEAISLAMAIDLDVKGCITVKVNQPRPATLIVALVVVQITLGALTVLSRRDVLVNSLHVVCGALVLATSLVVTLRTWRARFAQSPTQAGTERARADGLASPNGAQAATTSATAAGVRA